MAEACTRMKRPPKELSPEAVRQMLAYRWPGNVRELFNAIERSVVLSDGKRVELTDLPPEVQNPEPLAGIGAVNDARQTLAELERRANLATLQAEGGHRSKTAERLSIGQATLFRKLKQYLGEGFAVAPAA